MGTKAKGGKEIRQAEGDEEEGEVDGAEDGEEKGED